MKRLIILAAGLLTMAASSGAAQAATFNEQETGTSVFGSCNPILPCSFTYSGTIASGTPISNGAFTATGSLDFSAPGSCPVGDFTVGYHLTFTLTDAASAGSTVTKNEDGTLCIASLTASWTASGTWEITGGSGNYAGWIGTGTFTASTPAGGSTRTETSTEQGIAGPGCPAGTKVLFHQHGQVPALDTYDHGWSPTGTVTCPGTVTISGGGPEIEGPPGTAFSDGYAFRVPGNRQSFLLLVTNPRLTFPLRCASGVTLNDGFVNMPTQIYSVTDDQWTPTSDPHSPLVFQTSGITPDLCQGGDLISGPFTFTAGVG